MNSDRVRVLGQLLIEALDEKYSPEQQADRLPQPFLAGHGLTPEAATLDLKEREAKHWRSQAEKSAQSLAQAHAELKDIGAILDGLVSLQDAASNVDKLRRLFTGYSALTDLTHELRRARDEAQASARAWQEKALEVEEERNVYHRQVTALLDELAQREPKP